MMPIGKQAVLFDFDGTLVDYISADIAALDTVHAACGAQCPSAAFIDIAVEEIMAFHALVNKGKAAPLSMHPFRLEKTFNRIGIPWDRKFLSLYQNTLLDNTTPFDGAEELLAGLKQKGIKTALITNAYDGEEQRERLKRSGLAPYVDEVVISGEVGCAKPSPEIFHLTLDRLGVTAAGSVYIGDLEKYDIKGANAAGLYSILMCHRHLSPSTMANHTCHGIPELQRHLETRVA